MEEKLRMVLKLEISITILYACVLYSLFAFCCTSAVCSAKAIIAFSPLLAKLKSYNSHLTFKILELSLWTPAIVKC